tara:strand:- start:391 stop:729 length:339 start_codon:yes stop_codon:yes gene_type:complete
MTDKGYNAPNKGSNFDSNEVFTPSARVSTNSKKTFLECPLNNDKGCAMCGSSTFNPETGEHDGKERLFCGAAPAAWDLRVSSLPKCPLKMDKAEVRRWQAQMKKTIPVRRLQ